MTRFITDMRPSFADFPVFEIVLEEVSPLEVGHTTERCNVLLGDLVPHDPTQKDTGFILDLSMAFSRRIVETSINHI